MTSAEIRQQFIDFFVKRHGHTFVPSSPVVPHDDPTLLFTNAGMNQFKPIFLGAERRPYTRAANTQKCIRAGGKHNDLDDVGRSRRHHTFFEMLGNWSFGDYFKKEAIAWSWELLTQVWKLDPRRLHVSCYEGSPGVPRDSEAADIWRAVANWEQYGLRSDDHIHYFGKDNFWEMGDTGPCGPSTEIYVDRRPEAEIEAERKAGGRAPVNADDPRVMEIWNNVFIQYNSYYEGNGYEQVRAYDRMSEAEKIASGMTRDDVVGKYRKLQVLPAQHVDTGMGLERIIQVLQNVESNYEIDLFHPFWAKLKELSGITYTGQYPATNAADPEAEAKNPQLRHDIAFRVIADHVRCLTFALTDGALPSNEGRGYVLRRILRRAVRFGRQQLELRDPFLHKLVPLVVDAMGGAFPELKNNPGHVAELVRNEEVSFEKTLDRGIELFEGYATQVELVASSNFHCEEPPQVLDDRWIHPKELEFYQRAGTRTIPGAAAFKLHDTYGFPIDLTQIMAQERGMSVDISEYERLMEEARERARSGGKEGPTRLYELPPDILAVLQKQPILTTNDSFKFNAAAIGATVKAIWDGHRLIDQTHGAEAAEQGVAVILDKTNFYAEMGGQVGDTGELRGPGYAVMDVETTRAAGGYVLHVGRMVEGHLRVGDHVTATLAGVRPRTERNHTATHLANWALREVLGEGVQQKGSLVDPEKLRFDFSHGKALSEQEIGRVEELVSQDIEKKLPVYAEEAPQEQALKINGLRAVFGEKYPPMVRVVSIGAPVGDLLKNPTDVKWRQFSVEFCGGTHLKNTGEVVGFVVTAEESVSKGIRRIVALTGDAAREVSANEREVEAMLSKAGQAPESGLLDLIASIQRALGASTVGLRAKRRAQAAVAELQSKYKAWEKANRAKAGPTADVSAEAGRLLESASPLGPGKLVVGEIPGVTSEQLLSAMDSLKKKAGSYAVLLGSAEDGKVSFVAAVSDDLIKQGLKAGDWIKETAKTAGGGGGGRPQMAQGSGKNPEKLGEALEAAREYARQTVK
jgi:alanyl-tRNA synthetase